MSLRVVILAAGRGTRLGMDVPKPLAMVDDHRSLLSNQIDLYSEMIGPGAIRIVVGHEADRIREAFPDVECVVNTRFAETNTASSLLVGVQGLDDDVFWSNGDVYLEVEALGRMIAGDHSASRALVQPGSIDAEAVKYTLNENGAIVELAKELENACGESLGVNLIRRNSLPALRRALSDCDDNDYFEKALSCCIGAGHLELWPVDLGDSYCREVDFPEDLEAVRRHVADAGS